MWSCESTQPASDEFSPAASHSRDAVSETSVEKQGETSRPGVAAGWLLFGCGVALMLALRDRLEIQAWCQLATWLFFGTSKAVTLLRLGKRTFRKWTAARLIGYVLWPGM